MTTNIRIDTVVIGGGQSGLTVGYLLKNKGRDFVILDAGSRVGDGWRQRWDSLRLFTPSQIDGLPGLPFPAPPGTFPTKDEMADYLEMYAKKFALPVKLNSAVRSLSRVGSRFLICTDEETYEANNVVIAMARYQSPRIPAFAKDLDPAIFQIHSKDYRHPEQLRDGAVVVVGVGNSGGEIALELAKTRQTFLAGKETAVLPWRIDSPLFSRLLYRVQRFVFLHVLTIRTPIGRKVRTKMLTSAVPLIRVKPKDLEAAGVERVGRLTEVRDGSAVTEDGRILDVGNVVWCTGFRPGFSWLDLPILGERLEPMHHRGVVSSEPGLYFVGLHFQYSIASDTIPGHQRDARYVVEHLTRTRPALDEKADAPKVAS